MTNPLDPALRERTRRRGPIIAIVVALTITALTVGLTVAAISAGPTPTSAESGGDSSMAPSDEAAATDADADADTDADASTPVEPDDTTPPSEEAVSFDSPATVSDGVTATVTSMEAVQGESAQPGEIAGPAVSFTVAITNDSADEVDLSTVAVSAYYGADSLPALDIAKPGGRAFSGALAAGETADAVYIFTIPEDDRDVVSLDIAYADGATTAVFEGATP